MTDKDDLRKKMRQWGNESAEEADKILEDELEALKKFTSSNLEKLKPKVSDKEAYDKLIQAVEESKRKNESKAELKTQIQALGPKVIKVLHEAVDLLK